MQNLVFRTVWFRKGATYRKPMRTSVYEIAPLKTGRRIATTY